MQRRYDPKQVKKLKQQFKEKIQNMSPEELDEFRSDLDARLHILMGDEARDARRWLSDTLSVASDKYAKKVLADLPDVANLTSPELLSELDRFENRRAQTRQSVAATQQAQRDRTKSVQAQLREQRSASEKALDRAVQSSAAQGSNFVPSALHNRKSFSDRPNWVGVGFW
jgi:hypothetical protein